MADEQISDKQIGKEKRRMMGEVRRWSRSKTDVNFWRLKAGGKKLRLAIWLGEVNDFDSVQPPSRLVGDYPD
ncbi:hypothetical protein Q3G72_000010 [Acer saccharum]|nr:hypothetical protein Q3G72_000010 [Acer saccharum]